MASPVHASCQVTPPTSPVEESRTSRLDDPISASFRLYALVDMQDRALEQAQHIESYILSLTERIVRDASRDGHVGHGLLLLNRKCVAEGTRNIYLQMAIRKWRQIRECYNSIRRSEDHVDVLPDTDLDASHDHEVMQLARGLTRECCAFQRQG